MMDNLFLKKHFIFDLDGTLINSNLLHEKAFLEALDGLSIDFKYSDFYGVKTFDVFKALGFSDEKSKKLTISKQERYRSYVDNGLVEVFEGVSDLFNLLNVHEKKIYLCTGASRKSVDKISKLFSWNMIFKDTICGDEVEHSKPHPEILNSIIERNSIDANDVLYVEDSDKGLDTGLNAGVDTVIVHNYFKNAQMCFSEFFDFYDFVNESFKFKGVA